MGSGEPSIFLRPKLKNTSHCGDLTSIPCKCIQHILIIYLLCIENSSSYRIYACSKGFGPWNDLILLCVFCSRVV